MYTYGQRVADQLVIEVKAAMARAGIRSSRALARAIGESSQYVSMRLDGGNPRTGERVALNVHDLATIGGAVGVSPNELMRRAEEVVTKEGYVLAAMDRDDSEEIEAQQNEP